MSRATLLLLADGRFPAGGHAHSYGLEAVHALGAAGDADALRTFLIGRLHTGGRVEAAFAAAASQRPSEWRALDIALSARIVSPRQREVSRSLGRQLLRVGAQIWPDEHLAEVAREQPAGAHQAVVFGLVTHAAGLAPDAAALAALHHLASGVATAAVRIAGLDPFAVHAVLAEIAQLIDRLAAEAASLATRATDDLPAWSAPLTEILAEDHATWEVRLFAS